MLNAILVLSFLLEIKISFISANGSGIVLIISSIGGSGGVGPVSFEGLDGSFITSS